MEQVLHRLFPFARGLFEDKVSNIWYALSVLPGLDMRTRFERDTLVLASSALTLFLLSPVAVCLLFPKNGTKRPTKDRERNPLPLLLSLTNSALAFFLASFQVHEKSLLLALVPASLLLPWASRLIGWFQILGAFSMYPLLKKDGLSWAYFIILVVYNVTWGNWRHDFDPALHNDRYVDSPGVHSRA